MGQGWLRYNSCPLLLASPLAPWEHGALSFRRVKMIRIRGHVGEWPVDLSIELDDQDWAQLARQLPLSANVQVAQAPTESSADALWRGAQQLLREAGSMEGPQLLAELEALSGSALAGKRLLVRLRHSAQVRVQSGADAPIYNWVNEAG
jgi:hypothetical protein